MTMFIQDNATGVGVDALDAAQGAVDLGIIAHGDTGLGYGATVNHRQPVTYARTQSGTPPTRLDSLVNTAHTPNYGAGAAPVPIVILPVRDNFTFSDGRMITTMAGITLSPHSSGLSGWRLNTTEDCLVVYDTTENSGNGYCVPQLGGTAGTFPLRLPRAVLLFHELSHALRVVTNALLAYGGPCSPSSPEERAAIVDENILRVQIAGSSAALRDPGTHCAQYCTAPSSNSCCIIASVTSGSPSSEDVAALRAVRDGFLRRSEVGYAFFQTLFHDYYAFSPQIATILAGRPGLRGAVHDGFVRPLVTILQLMRRYGVDNATAAELGTAFGAAHRDRAASQHSWVEQARSWIADPASAGVSPDQIPVLAELLGRALESGHVVWALVEPLEIYERALEVSMDGRSDEAIGEFLVDAFSMWGSRLPLDPVWGSLPIGRLDTELAIVEKILLRTPASRANFRDRLTREFPDITAIQSLIAPHDLGPIESERASRARLS